MELRVAIIGCGHRGIAMAAAYQGNPHIRLTAACDVDEERRKTLCDRFQIPGAYSDWTKMLKEEPIDILHLATQPTFRKEPIMAAAEAKIPVVLSEKPIALSLPDLDEMLSACQKTGTRLIINHQLRYQSIPRRLKSAMERKEVGEATFLLAHCRMNALEQGTHLLDLVVWLKEKAKPQWAMGDAYGWEDFAKTHSAPGTVMGLIGFDDGTRCLAMMGPEAPSLYDEDALHFHFGIMVYGSQGRGQMWLGRWHLFKSSAHQSWTRLPYRDDDASAQRALQQDLVRAVNEPDFLHPCDARIGRTSLELIEALILSYHRQERVHLPLPTGASALQTLREQVSQGKLGG
ncbi:MAG: Gfo/Idh/MocA family oxidoreductase [Armatimonadetes bacterium]|nr:Gfo/Idh/MocA family oxidoreductase [Armatimonadota bacterium]MDW8122051.1 Gfo/Idh/MocA family oxidoreductase [Armatimonadota bacterium]